MAINQIMRQKKIARQNKREQKSGFTKLLSHANDMAIAVRSPVYQCFVADEEMRKNGMGNVCVSRKLPDGRIAVGVFLLDIYCLGVKNAFHTILDVGKYDEMVNSMGEKFTIKPIHITCARKLIEGGVDYARKFGFQPHPDYRIPKMLLNEADSSLCQTNYIYGYDGKPFYISGPNDDENKTKKIMNQLQRKCGDGNFHFMVTGPLHV